MLPTPRFVFLNIIDNIIDNNGRDDRKLTALVAGGPD